MLKKLFEFTGAFLKGLICGALLVAATATAIVLAFFAVMTAYRGIELLWHEVFSFPWTF